MKIGPVLFLAFSFIALRTATPAFAQEDAEGCKDNPYLSRMPGFNISECDNKEFDAFKFFDGKKVVSVEGRLYQNTFVLKEGGPKKSVLQIRRNYVNSIKNLGGTVLFEGRPEGFDDTRDSGELVWGKITKDGREIWIEVYPWDDENYTLTLVEKGTMKQEVTAGDLLKTLNSEGHVALYIHFDVNKATIKPDSEPILAQIAQMLKDSPSLRISIEGHTDNTGDRQANKTLSGQRAKAVLDALVGRGVDSKRLSAVGWGQDKPVADNNTEEGRSKNRRVEIVKL